MYSGSYQLSRILFKKRANYPNSFREISGEVCFFPDDKCLNYDSFDFYDLFDQNTFLIMAIILIILITVQDFIMKRNRIWLGLSILLFFISLGILFLRDGMRSGAANEEQKIIYLRQGY